MFLALHFSYPQNNMFMFFRDSTLLGAFSPDEWKEKVSLLENLVIKTKIKYCMTMVDWLNRSFFN